MKNIKENKKVILLFIPLILLFIIILGVTYAYFDINDTGETSSTMIIGGASITANYTISNVINIKDVLPSDDVLAYKDISITYDNTSNESFNVYLKAVIDYSTFTDTINEGVLYYDIYSGTNHDTLIKDKTIFPTLTYGKEVLYEIPIPANSKGTETYRINFYFPDSATKFQNKNGNLFLNGSIVLEETSSTTYTKSFANDSWETIANIVVNGDPTVYAVGSEKEVEIDGTNYTVRVANNTTPDECNNENFSQTACGFVVEFVDIVEKRVMNSINTNVGGWPASELRTYANEDFFNKLPSELQNVIIDTKVISGHGGTSGETNFTSTDKIYLLSGHEVYEDGTSNGVSTSDTSYNNTRQLDYYSSKGVTTNSYTNAIKQNNGSNVSWWLRSADSTISVHFLYVISDGDWSNYPAHYSNSFSPAFRIGDASKNVKKNYEFTYTGTEQIFTVPLSGTYKIETWGAQGGTATNDSLTYIGGYGGYSIGTISLKAGKVIYINVGGEGKGSSTYNTATALDGGYNGGGKTSSISGAANDHIHTSGGGATHMAFQSGLLKNLNNNLNNIIIVSGAGGGAFLHKGGNDYSGNGGSAGGYIGSSAVKSTGNGSQGLGGTQTEGGKCSSSDNAENCKKETSTIFGLFGLGGDAPKSWGSSGGAGLYGGGASNGDIGTNGDSGGGGGSSYIGNSLLTDKSMYCYNCTESSVASTKTVSTTCHSAEPTAYCAKEGNGYAKITFIY